MEYLLHFFEKGIRDDQFMGCEHFTKNIGTKASSCDCTHQNIGV
jgi:hypothetical protein